MRLVRSVSRLFTDRKQDVTVPIMTNPEYLWWAHTWHMQTPLETLGAGSFVAFELKEKVRADSHTLGSVTG